MGITFDHSKNAKNIAERGLPFSMVSGMDWSQTVILEDKSQRLWGKALPGLWCH